MFHRFHVVNVVFRVKFGARVHSEVMRNFLHSANANTEAMPFYCKLNTPQMHFEFMVCCICFCKIRLYNQKLQQFLVLREMFS